PERWRATLDELAAVDFETLVPGHGLPMAPAGFAAYREAFGAFLDCAASDSAIERCADGWIAGLGDLLPPAEHPFTRRLLGYYVGQILRGDPKDCAPLRSR
ncbi:MAG: hypothetical protein ACRD2J_01155, partial [Thermoanaerobaculia bacterium]